MDIIVIFVLTIIIVLLIDRIVKVTKIWSPDPDLPYSCALDGCGPDVPCPLNLQTVRSDNPSNPWPGCYLYQGNYMCCQKSPLN